MSKSKSLFGNLKSDFASGLVVFLVALPLCLGIALASGAPLFSGIIAGVVGGVIVGSISNSHISVSGPAAGLTAIVLVAISDLGTFELFLAAVVIAGIIQLILGFLQAGSISNYFPANVIEGMLAGIGIIIFLKQIPHALGFDADYEGDMAFWENGGRNTLTSIGEAFYQVQPGVVIVTLVSLLILIFWDKVEFLKKIKLVPAALVAVIVAILINEVFIATGSPWLITSEHLVSLPVPQNFNELKAIIITPDFSGLGNSKVYVVAITIAIVASIETLLCIEASDRMDPLKRYTSTNLELKAQGVGNILSGMLGGIPMTSVIVRSSANANAGAKTKMSAIIHGILLLVSVLTIPFLLNKIPLGALAAILLLIGYKLAKPSMFRLFYSKGKYQFIPFVATVIAVVFTDLLKGVALGMLISVFFVLKGNLKRAYYFRKGEYHEGDIIHLDLAQEVSFLNKASIKLTLKHLPENSKLIIDASTSIYIAQDVLDLIHEFKEFTGPEKNIEVQLIGFKDSYKLHNTAEESRNVSSLKNGGLGTEKELIQELQKKNKDEIL